MLYLSLSFSFSFSLSHSVSLSLSHSLPLILTLNLSLSFSLSLSLFPSLSLSLSLSRPPLSSLRPSVFCWRCVCARALSWCPYSGGRTRACRSPPPRLSWGCRQAGHRWRAYARKCAHARTHAHTPARTRTRRHKHTRAWVQGWGFPHRRKLSPIRPRSPLLPFCPGPGICRAVTRIWATGPEACRLFQFGSHDPQWGTQPRFAPSIPSITAFQ